MEIQQDNLKASEEPDIFVRRVAILVKLILAITPILLVALELLRK